MREFVVVFILLSFLGKLNRLYEFTGNYIVAGMVTLSVSGILDSRSLKGVSSYAIAGLHHPSGIFRSGITSSSSIICAVDSIT